ncbi:MAG TPA: NADP-dependent succinic semialdehyde dehydrogenase [Acidimicrobiales bacterium]|nr:NADP-dependent succinic semialdehyde dehydrogenase [Acidimicrobiales bacterium]
MPIATINPTTGETVRTFDALSTEAIEQRLARAAQAAAAYRATSFAQRILWMHRAGEILADERAAVADMVTTEMGKTRVAALAEVDKCAAACHWFADHAEALLADEPLADPGAVNASGALVRYEPLGVVLAIMPWNFPLWQAMRFAAPALMAGNVGLLKHASNVPMTALYFEDLFARAGLPDGAFQTLLVGSDAVERMLRDDRVAAATLTGSESAGAAVAAIAGEVIKPTVLELGGSDPFIVMPSADLDAAAAVATTSRCQNNGQSCIAAKRFIVHDAVYDAFAARFVAAMDALVVGDPVNDATDIGPLATEQGRADIEELVADAVAKGAQVLCGGQCLDRAGWFYPPTVLAGITEDMRVFGEEVFGPVAVLYRVHSIEDAITLANATKFALGSNAWTTDTAEQDRFVTDITAGAVFINGMTTSYVQLPFGGTKRSGYGRELAGHGIKAFCNAKTIWIA